MDAVLLVKGSPASPGIGRGKATIIVNAKESRTLERGDILVTEMTTPDFVPAMKRASAIVTDKGGRTCHAAIVSRELGIPCVVGTGNATKVLKTGEAVTVDATTGKIYRGLIDIQNETASAAATDTETRTKLYVNLADPELAEKVAAMNVDGVGLLRAEFIVAHFGKHPRYLLEQGRGAEFTEALASGIQAFTKAFHPRPVVYRMTDFKTNEYRNLEGGEQYEGKEENPMIGFRGASRYLAEPDIFTLETNAIAEIEDEFDNLNVMVPFVRTPEELANVKKVLDARGVAQGKLWMMAEVPSTALILDQFLDVGVDGVSIGSNDLTQLVLGVDRDNEKYADVFDERNPAVLWCLERIIKTARTRGVTVSICGQAPSFYPDLTAKLVEWGITSVSVSPDMIEKTRVIIADIEKRVGVLSR